MDYQLISDKVLEVYIECNIREFPIDCIRILQHYNFRLLTYKEIRESNPELHEMAKEFTNDAFQYKKIICYNSSTIERRIRFSLMHELGHYLLGHKETSRENEIEADYFASCVLAPRAVVWKLWCPTADDIHNKYGLSYAASNRVLVDLGKWKYRQHYDSKKALIDFLYPPAVVEKPQTTQKPKLRKGRHQKEWAEMEARIRFIEECYGSTTEFAFEQYERSLHLGCKI